jgi:hypothetical protein
LDFNWKIIHGVINTENKLKLMKFSDGKCKLCDDSEIVRHLLYDCKDLKVIWKKINAIICKTVDCNIDINDRIAQIGLFGNNTSNLQIINMLISITRWVIWKRINLCIFEDKRISITELTYWILNNIRNQVKILLLSKRVKINVTFKTALYVLENELNNNMFEYC